MIKYLSYYTSLILMLFECFKQITVCCCKVYLQVFFLVWCKGYKHIL